jgi:hypothetical protein
VRRAWSERQDRCWSLRPPSELRCGMVGESCLA